MNEPIAEPGRLAPADGMTNAVLDFRPSRHGFHFPNRYEPGRVQRLIEPGIQVMGMCGGMAFVVRDLFERSIDPPPEREPPARRTRRFLALYRRQIQSFDWLRLPLRFWILIALHRDPATWWSRLLLRRPLGDLVLRDEWPRIRAEIDAGRLAQVGVIRDRSPNPFRLIRNHQVLAYAYRATPERVGVRIYDPNWPDRDDVELRMELSPGTSPHFAQTTGEPVHGFFLTAYRPAEPRAWRTA